jgi:GT2 family glycosyltransferase
MSVRVCATVLGFDDRAGVTAVLNAVFSQTVRPEGVVLVENGHSLGVDRQDILVRSLSRNVGVGKGHNEALLLATDSFSPDWFWILEHDCIPDIGCLEDLCLHVADLPDVGAIVPTISRNNDERARARRVSEDSAHASPVTVDGTFLVQRFTFNGILLSSTAYRAAGPVREDFFIGHEDWEYSDRVRASGFNIAHRIQPTALHPSRGNRRHGVRESPMRGYYSVRNSLKLAIERRDWRAMAWLVARNIAAGAIEMCRRSTREKGRLRLRATAHAIVGRMGELC